MKQRVALATILQRVNTLWNTVRGERAFYDVYTPCVTAKQPQPTEIRIRNRLNLAAHVRGSLWPSSDDGAIVAPAGGCLI